MPKMRSSSQNKSLSKYILPFLTAAMVCLFGSTAHAVSVEFLSDSDGNYSVKNSSTSSIDCNAPNICDVAPGRYRLIQFDNFQSVYITVENDGSVRYTYDGGADFPFAGVATNTPTNTQPEYERTQVNFLSDNDGAYAVQNSITLNIDCLAPAICDVDAGRYRLINFNNFHSVYITVESNGLVRYTYDGGASFPFATATNSSTSSTTNPPTTQTTQTTQTTNDGFIRINFLSDSDSDYLVKNSATGEINCLAPAICDVAPGRYRLINFDNFHSVYVTVENNGLVRYTYEGTTRFPYAVTTNESPNEEIQITPTNTKPQPGSTLYWQLQGNIYLDHPVETYGIDLEDNEFNGVIQSLHNRGKTVICYISAGSYEAWRSDSGKFNFNTDIGNQLGDWPGEYYLNIKSDNVRAIMRSRIDRAVTAGCDALEPDNTDAYQANNGLGLSAQDQIDYLLFLANYARSKNLSIGLKNTVDLMTNSNLINAFDWTLNESCYDYNECDKLKPFIDSGKSVYIAMYGTQSMSARCADAASKGFNLSFYGNDQRLDGSVYYTCR